VLGALEPDADPARRAHHAIMAGDRRFGPKKDAAAFKMSFARRSSRISCSNGLIGSASSDDKPAR
jgi:hypothetical protein